MPPHKSTNAEPKLIRENDGLKTTICCLRHELENKAGYVGRLEHLLQKRTEQIDTLNAKIEQLRDQNKRLDAEADLLIAMIQLTPETPPLEKHA
jgi:CII-binding regulator of phage lambda lysogenization HflD